MSFSDDVARKGMTTLVFEHINVLVASQNPNIIVWMQAALQPGGIKHPVAKGDVQVGPLKGDGAVATFSHPKKAVDAVNMLAAVDNYSIHEYDERTSRFILTFEGTTAYIPLNRPLHDYRFIDQYLQRLMRDANVPEESIKLVFDRSKRAASENGGNSKQTDSNTPAGQDEDLLENTGMDARTLNNLDQAGIKTIAQLRQLYADKGYDGLIGLEGIGDKSAKQLVDLLEPEQETAG